MNAHPLFRRDNSPIREGLIDFATLGPPVGNVAKTIHASSCHMALLGTSWHGIPKNSGKVAKSPQGCVNQPIHANSFHWLACADRMSENSFRMQSPQRQPARTT
jgi:hypothetical protein